MLVLSRKSMQRIVIGDGIIVTVLEIRGSKVRLGIEAPRNVRVVRSELQDAIPEMLTGFVLEAAVLN